jgi:predicted DNA-binding transcriptional regulator YafY
MLKFNTANKNINMPNIEAEGYRKSIDILDRMTTIIHNIQNKQQRISSRQNLIEILEEKGYYCKPRTIDRDLAAIKEYFGIHIKYNHKKGHYEIQESDEEIDNVKLQKLLSLSQQYSNASQIIKTSLSNNRHIQYEDTIDNESTIKQLSEFLQAISGRKTITIHYQSYLEQTSKEITLEPITVKQSKNRWYIIGFLPSQNEYRSYGFERIISYSISKTSFKYHLKLEIQDILDNNYGAFLNSKDKPTHIKLKIENWRAEYFITQKLHHSQNIYAKDEKYTFVELNLVPNPQFYNDIASLLSHCVIIEPEIIKKQLLENLQKTISLY